jgi:transposase-like protein
MGCWKGSGTSFWGGPGIKGLDEEHDNYRNGYRPRRLNFFGLGAVELKVPRDRQGEFESAWLPERKAQDPETEAFFSRSFSGGFIDP